MTQLSLREPRLEDMNQFLNQVKKSTNFHTPWFTAPDTEQAFEEYLIKFQQPTYKAFFLIIDDSEIVGAFNIFDIVKGCFQSAYLGYYCFEEFSGKGLMSKGLKLVLNEIFVNLNLHRIEADIEPHNTDSINLVKANNFTYEGYSKNYLHVNGSWRDHERWALTLESWNRINC